MCAPKFATQTTIVCPEKFATNVAHVNRVVRQKPTVRRLNYVQQESANVLRDISELRLVAPISMNAPINRVTRVPSAKIRRVRLDAVAQNQLLVIHTRHPDAYCRINVLEAKTAPEIWLVSKANAPIRVRLPSADEMLGAKLAITRHFVIVLVAIWAIRPIRPLDASASNVSPTKIAASINNAIHKRINVKVSVRKEFLDPFIN